MERDIDGYMRRTAQRPLPAGRMGLLHAVLIGLFASIGGSIYLALFTNSFTGLLTLLTSAVYLAAGWNGARWFFSPSSSCGNSRIFFRSPGFTVRTMPKVACRCFR